VKKTPVLLLLASIALIALMILPACSGGGATTTVTVTAPGKTGKNQDPVKVLNPAGSYIPVDCVGLAPRLDSLAGKTILFYEAEATNMQMPTLLARLKKDYPTATFNVVYTELWGEMSATDEQKKNQACIRGIGW